MPGTRKLGRKTDHRLSMLKGMVTFLLEKGKIETTVTRAKEVSALADKMVTLGKANTLASRRQAMAFLKKESVVAKLFTVIAPLYSERNGGYTRVLKTGPRRGDGAEMAIITMVDAESVYDPQDSKKKKSEETKTEAKKTTEKKTSSKKTSDSVEKAAPKKAKAEGEATAKKTTRRTTKAKAEAAEAPAETATESAE
jgi:large subunit ribosomal protein L17